MQKKLQIGSSSPHLSVCELMHNIKSKEAPTEARCLRPGDEGNNKTELRRSAVSICQRLKTSRLARRRCRQATWRSQETPAYSGPSRRSVPEDIPSRPAHVSAPALIRNARGPSAATRRHALLRLVYVGGHSSRCSLDIKERKKNPRCPEINCAMMFTYLAKDAGHSRLRIFSQCQ